METIDQFRQPSTAPLSMVQFLDKHYSLIENGDAIQRRYRALASEMGQSQLATNFEAALRLIEEPMLLNKGNGLVSDIRDPAMQRQIAEGVFNAIRVALSDLRRTDPAKYDDLIKKRRHNDINVIRQDIMRAETMWRADLTIRPAIDVTAAEIKRVPVAAIVEPVEVTTEDRTRVRPAGRVVHDTRLAPDLKLTIERDIRIARKMVAGENYGFGNQPTELKSRMQNLPGVFTGDNLALMVLIANEMSQRDPALARQLLPAIKSLEADAAYVGQSQMEKQNTRSLRRVDTTDPNVFKLLVQGANVAGFMKDPKYTKLFLASLEALETRFASGRRPIKGVGQAAIQAVDYIHTTSFPYQQRFNATPAKRSDIKVNVTFGEFKVT